MSELPDPKTMNYVDFISYIDEVNRCPGGKRTINRIAGVCQLTGRTRILEIGSNTGFTSREFARLVPGARIVGIDINHNAVRRSRELLAQEPRALRRRVRFMVASAVSLPFGQNAFDLVVCGGANSFMPDSDRHQAISEYRRVLRPYGFVAVSNLFYHCAPPRDLVRDLNRVLGISIQSWTKSYWLRFLLSSGLELYHAEVRRLRPREPHVVEAYVSSVIAQSPRLADTPLEIKAAFSERWLETMALFNENHRYLSFLLAVLRNSPQPEQQELFLERGIVDPWNIEGPDRWW